MALHMSATGFQSALVSHKLPAGNNKVFGLTSYKRHNSAGRPAWSSDVKQRRGQAMASKDSDKTERSRLVSEALDFNTRSQDEFTTPQQHPVSSAASVPQKHFKAGQLLGGKYTVIDVLGTGKAGVVYKAERPGGGLVAVKALSLRSMADWKQLELFEREAAALRRLSHPGIPAYQDYFEVDSDGDRAYFLVQELVEGKSLAQMMEAGWRPEQREVERIAKDLLSTFSYLQGQKVVHRDVKPDNIILEGGKPGGKLFLVDFGGIQQGEQDVADSEVMDTGTLVGTYGYMAPEQLRGSARPASDLFALGGTLLYLLTGEQPSAFPQRRLRVDFSRVQMNQRLETLLTGLLQPAWEDRLTAAQAQKVLAGKADNRQRQQDRFTQSVWERSGGRSRSSGGDRQASQEQEPASTSGRSSERQGVSINNVLLALAAAYVLPGPLFPIVALTLPFWLSGKSRRRNRSSTSSRLDDLSEEADSNDSEDWMSGSQRRQQTGFGFSEGPVQDMEAGRGDTDEMSAEEQEARRMQRRQHQMAAFQQQQMMLNLMRMMVGGTVGGYRGGFGGPFGMRGGFRRGPFMF